MGWDTYLSIDDRIIEWWRKQAVYKTVLLFQESDLVVRGRSPERCSVKWVTTAARALRNLADAGFTWDILFQDYIESRPELSLSTIELRAWIFGKRETDKSQLRRLEESAPDVELSALGQLLLAEIRSDSEDGTSPDPIVLIPPQPRRACELLFGSDSLGVWPAAIGLVAWRSGVFEACRPLEYLLFSRLDAPLVAWAFSMMVLLHEAPSDARVELDLTEDAHENLWLNRNATPKSYARTYWKGAVEAISRAAGFYGRVFTKLALGATDIAGPMRYGRIETLLAAASENGISSHDRGARLEDLVGALVELSGTAMQVLEKRLKHADEELDLVLRNDLSDAFWLSFNSPLILVECKNWSSRVDIAELRILESKMRDRQNLCKIGIFVTLNGFTQPFLDRARDLQSHGVVVFCIDRADIEDLLSSRATLDGWLRQKGIRKIL